MLTLPTPDVFVGRSPGLGRGVFASRAIRAGDIIEVAPVVVVSREQAGHIEQTPLDNYVFDWEDGGVGVVLGYGMLYNHSYTPNAVYRKSFERHVVSYIARVDIPHGAEITINYNGDPDDRSPLWFDVV